MRKILMPTDFSSNADKALDFAVQVSKQAKAEHSCVLVNTTFNDHLTIKKEHNKGVLDKANERLALLKKSIEDTKKVTVNVKIYNGNVADACKRYL